MTEENVEEEILFSGEKNRVLSIIKTCEKCGRKYHPRRTGYEYFSRFCSQACTKKGRGKGLTIPKPKVDK